MTSRRRRAKHDNPDFNIILGMARRGPSHALCHYKRAQVLARASSSACVKSLDGVVLEMDEQKHVSNPGLKSWIPTASD